MKFHQVAQGVILEVLVKPGSGRFEINSTQDELVIFYRQPPLKGKANRELMKELSRLFHKEVEIVSGGTSKKKKILIKDITVEEAKRVLTQKRWAV